MIFSLFHVVLLGSMFLYMLNKAQGKSARRLSLVPLTMCVMEIILMGVLETALYPVLTGILILMRGTVLACCLLVMRADAAAARSSSRFQKRIASVTRLDATCRGCDPFTSRCA